MCCLDPGEVLEYRSQCLGIKGLISSYCFNESFISVSMSLTPGEERCGYIPKLDASSLGQRMSHVTSLPPVICKRSCSIAIEEVCKIALVCLM